MLDRDGLVCEYDGYEVPEQGPDTLENRILREKAMKEFKEQAKRIKEKHNNKHQS